MKNPPLLIMIRHVTALNLVVCSLASFGQTANKPVILYFNTSPDDASLSEASATRQQQLRDCGYVVQSSDHFGEKEWNNFLVQHKNERPKLILVEGHGINLAEHTGRDPASDVNGGEQRLFFTKSASGFGVETWARGNTLATTSFKTAPVTLQEGELNSKLNEWERIALLNFGLVEDADRFLSKVEETFPGSHLWLDTCHSGSCRRCEKIGIGTSCSTEQKSYDDSKLTDDIVSLLCDSGPKGQCKLWRTVDVNADGTISPTELRSFWEKKYAAEPEVEASAQNVIRTHLVQKELVASLGVSLEKVKLAQTFPASIRVRYGTGQKVMDNEGRLVSFAGETSAPEVADRTGITLPEKPTQQQFGDWKAKVIRWAEQHSDERLAGARFDYLPETYEYSIRGVKSLQPFSPEAKKRLIKHAEAQHRSLTPHLGSFALKGEKCAEAKQHEITTRDSSTH